MDRTKRTCTKIRTSVLGIAKKTALVKAVALPMSSYTMLAHIDFKTYIETTSAGVLNNIWGGGLRIMRCPELVLSTLHDPCAVDPFFGGTSRLMKDLGRVLRRHPELGDRLRLVLAKRRDYITDGERLGDNFV